MNNSRWGRAWIDSLTFTRIFTVWVAVVILFGLIYHFNTTENSYLSFTKTGNYVDKVQDTVYFSFITATTTGFGDIAPNGYFKFISIIEVILGLLLLALVTSKLVSIKQDLLLGEIFEISFKERINRLRSSLLLFRQNISRQMSRKSDDSRAQLFMLKETLNEIYAILPNEKQVRKIGSTDLEILLNSMILSFEKLRDYLKKRPANERLVMTCLNLADKIFDQAKAGEELRESWQAVFDSVAKAKGGKDV